MFILRGHSKQVESHDFISSERYCSKLLEWQVIEERDHGKEKVILKGVC